MLSRISWMQDVDVGLGELMGKTWGGEDDDNS